MNLEEENRIKDRINFRYTQTCDGCKYQSEYGVCQKFEISVAGVIDQTVCDYWEDIEYTEDDLKLIWGQLKLKQEEKA